MHTLHISLRQICADDSSLALVPKKAHEHLFEFSDSVDAFPTSLLQNEVPSFGLFFKALERHTKPQGSPPPPPPPPLILWEQLYLILRRLTAWMHRRVVSAWSSLNLHEPQEPSEFLEDDWTTSGSLYGLPTVRRRCKFPGILNDQKSAQADRVRDVLEPNQTNPPAAQCNKFYDAEKKLRMNGGIMVLWCRHAICLGFHVICTGEGRDDVFSALFTK